MFVVAEFRGTDVGSKLLARVIEAGLAAKIEVLRLETTEFLPDAQRLYLAKGFVPCEAYGPYRDNPINLYLEKILLPKSVL
jgi:putative acetyltransferase